MAHHTDYQFGDQTKAATTGMRGGFFRGLSMERNIFREQDLRSTDFYGANLRHIDGRGADFRQCNLGRADMAQAYLQEANLRNADLSLATLHAANLAGADLRGARLWGADLSHADLSGADLRLADLRQVRLDNANLEGALLSPHQILPEEGAFVGWRYWDGKLFKWEIPKEARRSNSIGDRMGRADRVRILAVWDSEGEMLARGSWVAADDFTMRIVYDSELVAEEYSADPRDSRPRGIPFFLSREEALCR